MRLLLWLQGRVSHAAAVIAVDDNVIQRQASQVNGQLHWHAPPAALYVGEAADIETQVTRLVTHTNKVQGTVGGRVG